MHSRAVLLVSLFAVACLVIVGSLALHLSTASASSDDDVTIRNPSSSPKTQNTPASEVSDISRGRTSSTSETPSVEAAHPVLSPMQRASVDSLKMLLRHVHASFDPEGASVSNAMIPYLAQMISMINQHDQLTYVIEIMEPDPALAEDRAQTLNNVLRLNVLEPSKVRIEGRRGMRAALLEASPL